MRPPRVAQLRATLEQVGGLPKFVVDEFEAYLRCGILEHGLAHFACRRCGQSRAVAWSCKARGFCPSCIARRMSDCAAHLVDEVLPRVPARQWVASLPWQLRYAMGYDAKLCSAVLAEFMRALRRSLRRRAKLALGLRSVEEAKFGAVTMIQRADSSLRLNVHFHCLVLDAQPPDEGSTKHFWGMTFFDGHLYVATLSTMYVLENGELYELDTGLGDVVEFFRLDNRDGMLWSIAPKDLDAPRPGYAHRQAACFVAYSRRSGCSR